jgi:hypothetical protein
MWRHLALTPRRIVFHSAGLLLLISPTVRVIPIATISALGVLLIAPQSDDAAAADVHRSDSELLKLTVTGGAQLEFAMPDRTPGHTRRVADLVGCLRSLISAPVPVNEQANAKIKSPPYAQPTEPTIAHGPMKKVDKIAERLEALRKKPT